MVCAVCAAGRRKVQQIVDVGKEGNRTVSVAGPLNGTNVTVANKTVSVTTPFSNVTTNGTANTTTVTVNLPGVGQILSIGINSGGWLLSMAGSWVRHLIHRSGANNVSHEQRLHQVRIKRAGVIRTALKGPTSKPHMMLRVVNWARVTACMTIAREHVQWLSSCPTATSLCTGADDRHRRSFVGMSHQWQLACCGWHS
jgi:hypothetical protein